MSITENWFTCNILVRASLHTYITWPNHRKYPLWLVSYIYPAPSHEQDLTQDQFLSGGFEIRFFLFLECLPRLKSPVCPCFFHSWGENSWIYTFPKGINALWKANSLVSVWTQVTLSISSGNNHYTSKRFGWQYHGRSALTCWALYVT